MVREAFYYACIRTTRGRYDRQSVLEPDGTFPNHIPNPDNKEAIASIQKAVKESDADLGIIFDTDVDRARCDYE